MAEEARTGTFRSALAHRDYRYLLTSLAVSETGNWLYASASVINILQATGSPARIGIASVVRLLPTSSWSRWEVRSPIGTTGARS